MPQPSSETAPVICDVLEAPLPVTFTFTPISGQASGIIIFPVKETLQEAGSSLSQLLGPPAIIFRNVPSAAPANTTSLVYSSFSQAHGINGGGLYVGGRGMISGN